MYKWKKNNKKLNALSSSTVYIFSRYNGENIPCLYKISLRNFHTCHPKISSDRQGENWWELNDYKKEFLKNTSSKIIMYLESWNHHPDVAVVAFCLLVGMLGRMFDHSSPACALCLLVCLKWRLAHPSVSDHQNDYKPKSKENLPAKQRKPASKPFGYF